MIQENELMIHDEEEASLNDAPEPHFNEVAWRLSRRKVMGGGLAAAAAFFTGSGFFGRLAPAGASLAGTEGESDSREPGPAELLGFTAIPFGFDDEVDVPPGYSAHPFIPWGTPILGSYPTFVPGTPPLVPGGNTAAQQAEQVGMHHDGMHYFPLESGPAGNRRGLLVVNHEYTDEGYLHTGVSQDDDWLDAQREAWTEEMVRKSQNAHGVGVVEIAQSRNGRWEVVRSRHNRRITANTPMRFSGPATGNELLRTSADPRGRSPHGTINNCAHGFTPWGTYLTCEENFNGYFRLDEGDYDAEHAALNSRYGVGGDRYNWSTHDDRFVVTADEPNEPNRFGWVVEIDPFEARSTPVKRTALGRMKHEGAFIHIATDGRAVAYMGDDQVNEYIYKFVSGGDWRALQAQGRSPLDEGVLFVAKFNDDGRGEWLPLVHGRGPLTRRNGFADQGEVLVKTRLAASMLGATPMDRPEWTSVDPNTGLVYCTLTNNTSEDKVVNAANPRKPNPWGHIVRWEEAGGDHGATSFTWDLFVLAGAGRNRGDGSTVQAEDAFGSPDGLWVDPDGRVWIQTDGTQPAEDANNQMLVADPYVTDGQGTPEIKRFLTGVRGCEVTGVITTPDQRTMFVNLQHPGEFVPSTWPHDDGLDTPRSGTLVITKAGGGVVGS